MFFWLLLFVAVIVAVVWYARRSAPGDAFDAPHRSTALETLEQRYARGEIDRDEFLAKKADLGG